MVNEDEHVAYLRRVEAECLRCHSCHCFHSTSRVGLVCYGELATLLLHDEFDEFERSVFGCHQCGMCLRRCPREFNAKEFMAHARALMEYDDHDRCHVYDGVRVDLPDNVFDRQKLEHGICYDDALEGDGPCSRLFLPGCHMSSFFPELTKKVADYLIEIDVADGMTALCCGNPLYASGLHDEMNAYLQKLDGLYREHEVREVVTPCPSCFDFFHRAQSMGFFTGLEISCLSQRLVERKVRVRREALPDGCVVTIHDSCPDRKRGVFARSLRTLYEDFELQEMSHHHEGSLCCGSGGLVPPYSAEIAQEGKDLKRGDFDVSGATLLVTTCFNCYRGLAGILPVHQYLMDLMEAEA